MSSQKAAAEELESRSAASAGSSGECVSAPKQHSSFSTAHVCPICLDPPDNASQTVARTHECCGSQFCRDCIIFWACEKGKNTCPTCRTVLSRLLLEPDGTIESLRQKKKRTTEQELNIAEYNAHGAAAAADDDDDGDVVDDAAFRLRVPARCEECGAEFASAEEPSLGSCQCCGAANLCTQCLGTVTAPGMRAPASACMHCVRSPPRRRVEPCTSAAWSAAAAARLEGRCDVCGDVGVSLHTCAFCGLEQVHTSCGQRIRGQGLTCGRCEVPWAMRVVRIRGSGNTLSSTPGAQGVAGCASTATRTATASSSRNNGTMDGSASVEDDDWELWRMAEHSSSQTKKQRSKRKRDNTHQTSAAPGSADRRSVVSNGVTASTTAAENNSTGHACNNYGSSPYHRKRSRRRQ